MHSDEYYELLLCASYLRRHKCPSLADGLDYRMRWDDRAVFNGVCRTHVCGKLMMEIKFNAVGVISAHKWIRGPYKLTLVDLLH